MSTKQLTSRYASRPSPPHPAKSANWRNKIVLGNDGNMWKSVADKNGRFYWKRTDLTREREPVGTYYTLDNGGWSFKVKIGSKSIEVYRNQGLKNLVLKIDNPLHIFIGEGNTCDDGGNSILVKVDHLKYVYIGEIVAQFSTKETITRYRSPVGNSAVPYPWAESKSNAYLLGLGSWKVIPKTSYKRDPYDHYFKKDMKGFKRLYKNLIADRVRDFKN